MSLNTAKLKTDLKSAYLKTYATDGDREAALVAFINDFAALMESYIKSAQVNYTGGLTAGSNPVTGSFNGNIS